MYVIVTNYVNWHRENLKFAAGQGKHREFENTISVGTLPQTVKHAPILRPFTPYNMRTGLSDAGASVSYPLLGGGTLCPHTKSPDSGQLVVTPHSHGYTLGS